jgi:mevalonate kinase
MPLGFLKKQDDFFENKNEHLVKDYISLHNKKSFYMMDIEMDIVKAMDLLKNYGVTQSEIQQLVYKHLKKSR